MVGQSSRPVSIRAHADLLKECVRLRRPLKEGKTVHAQILSFCDGLKAARYLGNCLLHMYWKCGTVNHARKLFNALPRPHVVSWTLMMSAYADAGDGREALLLFRRMLSADRRRFGLSPHRVTLLVLLKVCAGLRDLHEGKTVHACIHTCGLEPDAVVRNAVVDMYAKCGDLATARRAFDGLCARDIVSWNTIIGGYARLGLGPEALEMFRWMWQEVGVKPDGVTFVVVLNVCDGITSLPCGKHIHACVHSASESEYDIIVNNSLIDMYSKCGHLSDALRLFHDSAQKDVVTWNILISGLTHHGRVEEAYLLFNRMIHDGGIDPNRITFLGVVKACHGFLQLGKRIHSHIKIYGFDSDAFIGSALIDMYAKCGALDNARQVFNDMHKHRNVVAWNSMVAGYARNGLGKEALALFEDMRGESINPDKVTFVAILKACAGMAALEEGKRIHKCIEKLGLDSDIFIESALVDMYAKCGSVEEARRLFNGMTNRNVVSFGAMIAGYAHNGQGNEALALLVRMKQEGVKPDKSTFVSVLSACSNGGLVHEAKCVFDSMRDEHGVEPSIEHYSCVVDLLARSGHLLEAESFILKMPIRPTVYIWMAVLSACRTYGNGEIGRRAFQHALELDPQDGAPGAYSMLSNIYSNAGRWDKLAKLQTEMQAAGVKLPVLDTNSA